jgi:hypothetical protein
MGSPSSMKMPEVSKESCRNHRTPFVNKVLNKCGSNPGRAGLAGNPFPWHTRGKPGADVIDPSST